MPHAYVRDFRMHYEVHGSGSELIVFISGTGWNGEHWKLKQIPYFAKKYSVVTFDHRGTGRSQGLGRIYSTRDFATDVAYLLEEIGFNIPANFVGHSMGGKVAQWIALDYPELVRTLTLAASGPGPLDGSAHSGGISADFLDKILREGWPNHFNNRLHETTMFIQQKALMIAELERALSGPTGLASIEDYLGHVIARQTHQTIDRLVEIKVPSLVIVGADDEVMPSIHVTTSRACADRLPRSEFVSIKNAAHALHLEAAEEFNERLYDFFVRN